MSTGPQLRTERLLLRRWQSGDRRPFAAMNADPVVMEHFPAMLSSTESTAMIGRIELCFETHGYGLWAIELLDEQTLIGFAGLSPVEIEVPFAPAVEVGWRLARPFWGHGLAGEAASAAVGFGFCERGLPEIVSFTAMGNRRSRKVMERLGMRHDPSEDFDHPLLGDGDCLRRHVLYRLSVARWRDVGADAGRYG